jgi:hypothetical protein
MMPIIVSRETLEAIVRGLLVYIMIGSVIWMVLDGLGIIQNTFVARPNATKPAMVLATLMMIFAWPRFVYVWIKGMRRAS